MTTLPSLMTGSTTRLTRVVFRESESFRLLEGARKSVYQYFSAIARIKTWIGTDASLGSSAKKLATT